MKSHILLATALACSGAVLTLAPADAAAQKNRNKKQKEDPNALKLTPAIVKPAQAAQTALQASDVATAEPLVAQVEAGAQTDDDKYIAATMRYNLEVTKIQAARQANPNAPVNETALAGPLDALLASPRVSQTDKARYAFRRGALAFNGKAYAQAAQYLSQAKQLGYVDPNLDILIAKARMESGDMATASQDLDNAITQASANGGKAPEDYYRYAIAQANQKKDVAQAANWMAKYVAAYPTAKNWRDIVVVYGLQQNSLVKLDDAQKIDLYRLLRAQNALADQYDYKIYADLIGRRGLPWEVQSVLKDGIAAGKLQATDVQVKDLLTTAANQIKIEGSLAPLATKAAAAADGKLAASTADAYLGEGTTGKAVELYRLALQKGVANKDEVNTHLGIALAKSGDKAGAKAAFDAVTTAPRKGIAQLWTASLGLPQGADTSPPAPAAAASTPATPAPAGS